VVTCCKWPGLVWSGCVSFRVSSPDSITNHNKQISNESLADCGAARCETWDSGRTLAGTAGSNPVDGCVVSVVCCELEGCASG
jgi:hypothetical protein